MQTAAVTGVERIAEDLTDSLAESWIEAIDRVGSGIRAMEYVESNLELSELRRNCGRIREISCRLGLDSPADLASVIDRLARSCQSKGKSPAKPQLKAMADGAYRLATIHAAVVARKRLPQIHDARARLVRMGEPE